MSDADTCRQTFADMVKLIEPVTSSTLSAEAVEALTPIASRLPPVACGGFEFSLLDSGQTVDVMQCHMLDEAGRHRLASYIRGHAQADRQPWTWLSELVAGDVSGLHAVWLEFDVEAGDDAPPAIFLEFDPRTPPSGERLLDLLQAIPLADKARKVAAITALLQQLPGQAHVSHFGAMFSRPDTPMRVNVKRLKSDEIEPFLSQAGVELAGSPAAQMLERAYRATVCLDYLDRWLPRVGVEYSFSSWPAREAGWRDLADLVAPGQVDAGKWQALADWAGVISPLEAKTPWPASCILDELCHAVPARSIIECGPSHVKATFDPRGLQSLKAYVGFRPALLLQDNSSIPGDARITQPPPRDGSIDSAIGAAVDFLLADRTQDGLWRDFAFARLASDEWVSGYIGAHLADLDMPACSEAASQAWHILRQRREPGAGWGYHRTTPPDADSTAWTIVLAQRLGLGDAKEVEANLGFLRRHLDEDGAAVTYSRAMLGGIGQQLPDTQAHQQWCGNHAEVTASAALAGCEEALGNLLRTQSADGSWTSFWIESDAYATGLACEALAQAGGTAARNCIDKAARWAAAQLEQADLGAFNRSWLLRAVLLGEDRDEDQIAKAVRHLVAAQRPDGSWPADCAMLVPVMDDKGATERTVIALDLHRNFTTATALGALHRVQQRQAA